ncbi:MAG: DUF1460 domain-containing protein [Syntrophobacterales bacterium]|nr:DUF1460 domain-containing protein [Syntrophobacterales bacterium]
MDKKREAAVFLPEDRKICETLLGAAAERKDNEKTLPELAVSLGKQFLGAPYQPQTLEREGGEILVANLRAFDCMTFVESVIALALAIKSGETDCQCYLEKLKKIRYRGGLIDGYPSRLHYFTDWLGDNEHKGLAVDMTSRLGGLPVNKSFNELTRHRDDHPPLQDDAIFRKMQKVEAACSRRAFHFIPKERWGETEGGIADGDLIAITTNREGIDVLHVGFAVLVKKKAHLMHASSKAGAVVLSDVTLNGYLREKRSRTGVIVGRLRALPSRREITTN